MRFTSFLNMFGHWAKTAPDAPALRFASGGELREMPWSVFFEGVRSGAEKEPSSFCTGFFFNDVSPDLLIRFFSTVSLGRRVVLLDANAPEEVLRAQILETGADTLLGDEDLAEELSDALSAPKEENADSGILFNLPERRVFSGCPGSQADVPVLHILTGDQEHFAVVFAWE